MKDRSDDASHSYHRIICITKYQHVISLILKLMPLGVCFFLVVCLFVVVCLLVFNLIKKINE